jgi:acyl carrier protein
VSPYRDPSNPIVQQVLVGLQRVLAQHAEIKADAAPLLPEARVHLLYEHGHIDSLATIEIVLELEEMFEIDISDEEMGAFERPEKTVLDLAMAIAAKRVA